MKNGYTKAGVAYVTDHDDDTRKQVDEMPNELGDFIREWREGQGKTIRDLAQEIGISNSTLSDIETGRQDPRMKTLEAIARVMEVDPDYFFLLRRHVDIAAADYDADVQRAIHRHPLMNPVRKRDMLAILDEDIKGRDTLKNRPTLRRVAEPRQLYKTPPNVIAAAGDIDDLNLPGNKEILDQLENDDD